MVLIDYSTFESDGSEVSLLNFLSGPVFLLCFDLFINYITGKEMLTSDGFFVSFKD
jgi:hypothetical protein